MATEVRFVEFVQEQARLGGRLTHRKMFGEYGIYLDGKLVALACDNKLFVKPTEATETLGVDLPTGSPYPGAKPHVVANELLDDPDRLSEFLTATAERLPMKAAGKVKARKK